MFLGKNHTIDLRTINRPTVFNNVMEEALLTGVALTINSFPKLIFRLKHMWFSPLDF